MVAIDSFKVRLELDKVQVINGLISDHFAEVSVSTGEVDETTFKRKRFKVDDRGIKTSYLIQKRTGKGREQKEFLLILVNAKTLERNYLEGITPDNIEQVFHYIQNQGHVKFNLATFLNADITDVDIKFDYQVKDFKSQLDIVQTMKSLTKFSKHVSHGYDARELDTNCGIQWNKRETATESRSYLKIYAKDIELYNNSRDFWLEFFNKKLPPIMRMEGTIKNFKHWEYLRQRLEAPEMFKREIPLSLGGLTAYQYLDKLLGIMLRQNIEEEMEQQTRQQLGNIPVSDLLALCLLSVVKSVNAACILVDKWEGNKDKRYQAKQKIKKVSQLLDEELKERTSEVDSFIDAVFNPQRLVVGDPEEKLLGTPLSEIKRNL
jgi:predicted DNA-binding ArsR family transcriptional regulator